MSDERQSTLHLPLRNTAGLDNSEHCRTDVVPTSERIKYTSDGVVNREVNGFCREAEERTRPEGAGDRAPAAAVPAVPGHGSAPRGELRRVAARAARPLAGGLPALRAAHPPVCRSPTWPLRARVHGRGSGGLPASSGGGRAAAWIERRRRSQRPPARVPCLARGRPPRRCSTARHRNAGHTFEIAPGEEGGYDRRATRRNAADMIPGPESARQDDLVPNISRPTPLRRGALLR